MHSFKDDFPGIRTTNSDVVVEEVKRLKGYKKNAIVRWRKNKCRYPLFRCAFVAKKDYRKDAITRWKFKKTNCRSALTSNVFFHYNVQETFVILGRMSNVICYDLMHKKRNRTCNAVGNLNVYVHERKLNAKAVEEFDVLVAENLHVLAHESDRNSNVVENLDILVGERNINCNVAENVDVLLDVSGVMNKKSYRKEAISRWKKKREKYDVNPRMRIVNRKGKHLLQQIASASDVLPDVRCCRHCLAFEFYSETANFCCLDGRVVLSSNELPALMKELLISPSEEASLFRTYIRTYHNHFAFTSLGVKSDTSLSKRNKGIYTFRVQGQMYHFINSLLPEEDECKNLQLYFHDTEKELENRCMYSPRLSTDLIAKCVECLKDNLYARFFRNLRDIPNLDEHKIILKTIPGQDQRVFNKPEVSQVAAIWIEGEENGEHGRRSIEVKLHSDCSKSVEYYYGCYDPLQYPLMFPYGELGWHQHIPKKKLGRRGATNDVCAVDSLISPVMAALQKNF